MNPITLVATPITGDEALQTAGTPYAALVGFYRAFNRRDLAAMGENWERSPEIAMANPLGGLRRGWDEVRAVYERLFHGPAQVYVELYDYTLHEHGESFYAVGRERGQFVLGDERIPLAIRTSRVYRRTGGGWRQVHHHGSIDDPALLARYQRAVLGDMVSPAT
jgi:ketosteroid isomerase-like protein